jgi:hypothetical protein
MVPNGGHRRSIPGGWGSSMGGVEHGGILRKELTVAGALLVLKLATLPHRIRADR